MKEQSSAIIQEQSIHGTKLPHDTKDTAKRKRKCTDSGDRGPGGIGSEDFPS